MDDGHRVSVIVPAAGGSRRFGDGKRSKLEVELAGRSVLVRAIELFSNRSDVHQIIVAVPPDDVDAFKFKWGDKLGFLGAQVVPGGKVERWETVASAIGEVVDSATHIAVHDAARPVADSAMIDRVFEAAQHYKAVVPALRISDTLKRAETERSKPETEADPLDAILGSAGKVEIEAYKVTETVPRAGLWAVQTPQVFDAGLLRSAYQQVAAGAVGTDAITDDAVLVEAMGEPVYLVEGDPYNVKITYPGDVDFAAAVLSARTGKPAADGLGPKRKFPTWAESEDD
jgi:2-C-methyl-D-erythritol 4-phosphate cytidylyltransferase